jgi:hypothetical protein
MRPRSLEVHHHSNNILFSISNSISGCILYNCETIYYSSLIHLHVDWFREMLEA